MRPNISEEHKFVYLAVPRTGSRLTFTHLQEYGVVGGAAGRMTHVMDVPLECSDWLVVFCTRNPYTRWISYWSLVKQWPVVDYEPIRSITKFAKEHPQDFKGFAQLLQQHHVFRSISQDVGSHSNFYALRYEDLNNTFNGLPFVTREHNLGIIHRPETLDWRGYYDKETKAIVCEEHIDDFMRFKYTLDLDSCEL